jgi:hypothetical protein
MMIKVFGAWINPDHILCLELRVQAGIKRIFAVTYESTTNSGDILAVWDGKSLNEVGTEINKQIAKTKETYNL